MLPNLADLAGLQVAEQERAVPGPDEAADLQSKMFEHAAHFAVLALGQDQLDPGIGAGAPLEIGVDRSVADAVDLHAVDQFFELGLADLAIGARPIGALDAGRGQLQLAL